MNRLQLKNFKQSLDKVLNEYSSQSTQSGTSSGKGASGTPEDTVDNPNQTKPQSKEGLINKLGKLGTKLGSTTKKPTNKGSSGTSSGKGASGTSDDV